MHNNKPRPKIVGVNEMDPRLVKFIAKNAQMVKDMFDREATAELCLKLTLAIPPFDDADLLTVGGPSGDFFLAKDSEKMGLYWVLVYGAHKHGEVVDILNMGEES